VEVLGYIASILIGITLGLLGGGGSILTIPILVYLFKLDAITATAYSLFIVGVTSLVGVVPKYKLHLVDLRTGLLFGLPSLLSIFITRKWIITSLPDIIFTIGSFAFTRRLLLLGLFAVLMILASFSMIKGKSRSGKEGLTNKVPLLIIEGLFIGFLTGLVGAGGGFLIIPALVLLTGMPMKKAAGTSLLIIGTNSIVGFAGDLLNHSIDWLFLAGITAMAILGIFAGHRLTKYYRGSELRKIFGWFTLTIGILILAREIIFLN
jgi:hypothetical protein